jgi:hypothetical protein
MKTLAGMILILLISFTAFSQKCDVGAEMYVISEGGLNLRSEPKLESDKLAILKKGSKVVVDEIASSMMVELQNGYRGHWVKIVYEGMPGYLFDAYLSNLPPFEFLDLDNNRCWSNDVLEDMSIKIGRSDALEYFNYADGEGHYRIKIYPLINGDKYIVETFTEHIVNEIQLHGLSVEEIDQFVMSFLKFCNDKDESFKIIDEDRNKYIDIIKYDDCCLSALRVKIIDDILVVRTRIDPR